MKSFPYWLEVPAIVGEKSPPPQKSEVVVIGSGLAGASAAYFLQKSGLNNVVLIDHIPDVAASFRNCGHILYGGVESMKALNDIHGEEKAREVWAFSAQCCEEVYNTVQEHGLNIDYRRDGYLVLACNEAEDRECLESIELLNRYDFPSTYLTAQEVRKLGFKNTLGARFDEKCSQAHPVKFRNEVLNVFLKNGGRYHSGVEVTALYETGDGVEISSKSGDFKSDFAVICGNAYSPLFSEFFNSRRLIEPFRGQILTSKPMRHEFAVKYPHSFNRGYEYALVTEDNRLMLGGWRQNTKSREMGTYELTSNSEITQGLTEFFYEYYDVSEKIEWEYEWTGIMGASKSGFPYIGPTNSDRIFACAGFTGHGFSWAHGSAKLLAKIMMGEKIPDVAKYFNPRQLP